MGKGNGGEESDEERRMRKEELGMRREGRENDRVMSANRFFG
jgi:hypothetical protein